MNSLCSSSGSKVTILATRGPIHIIFMPNYWLAYDCTQFSYLNNLCSSSGSKVTMLAPGGLQIIDSHVILPNFHVWIMPEAFMDQKLKFWHSGGKSNFYYFNARLLIHLQLLNSAQAKLGWDGPNFSFSRVWCCCCCCEKGHKPV